MVEPSGHCPYLGLKQNQAIRFASPTPEHRCYATGQAQEIPTFQPDYQARYCLSSGHVRCPLYTGSGQPSTPPVMIGAGTADLAVPPGGLRGWFAGLSQRDRSIYLGLLTLLVFIVGIYLIAGVNLLRENGVFGGGPGSPVATASTGSSGGQPSDTPAIIATVTPSSTLTSAPPTLTSTPPPPSITLTSAPPTLTFTSVPPPPPPTLTNTAAPLTPIEEEPPTAEPPTAEPPTAEPPTAEPPTAEPPTAEPPTAEPPTAEPPTAEPPTAEPPTAEPEPARTPEPQPPPEGQQTRQQLTLYFTDATDTLYVSVARLSTVVDQQVALATLNGMIAGPQQASLKPLTPSDARLIAVRREGSLLIANFDRRPAWPGDDRGLYAIALSLTELPGVNEVQIQVNGANIGIGGGSDPIPRRTINPDNPQGLSERFDSGTRFLPLYLLSSGGLWVRITRLIPRTDDVARATLDALLEGPGGYGSRVYSAIPSETRARGLSGDGQRAVVDLTRPFLAAFNRQAAVDAIVYSLTELRASSGARLYTQVEILVEGHKLSDYWGSDFDRQFTRKSLNPE